MFFAALFLAVCVFCTVWFFLERQFGPESSAQREKRLRERIFSASRAFQGRSLNLEKREALGFLDRFLGEESIFRNTLPLWLARARLPISVSFFLIFSFSVALIVFFLVDQKYSTLIAEIGGGVALFLPFAYLHIKNQIYLRKFQEHFPDAISALSNSLKVGHGLEVGLGSAIDSADYPVKQEFQAIQGELKLGIPTPAAFQNFYNRIQTPEARIFWMGISIHEELGGNITEVLDNLEKTIRVRFELQREIRVLSSQGRFGVITISLVPVFATCSMFLTDKRGFLEYLNSDIGHFVTPINILSIIVGVLWMNKIVDLRD